jgi:Uma2 family endonuclease
MSRQLKTYVSPEDYLARERKAKFKSEYFDGEIVAFAGTSREHNLIVWNFAGELRTQLKGKQCEAYSADMRVKAARGYVYPDVVAVCGPPAFADDLFDVLVNPTLLVEVLSESTEFYDRNIKSNYYRAIESLSEYLFVSQTEYHVEQYTRQPDGKWVIADIRSLDDNIGLISIGCKLSLREIYDRVDLSKA